MKDVLIGIVVGVVALIAGQWLVPRVRPVTDVRELSTVWGNASLAELGKPLIPATQPDPVAIKLQQPLDRFEVTDKTLDQAVASLAERTGCNFFTDWASLEAAGATRADRFSIVLRNLSASAALKQILNAFAPTNVQLAYRIEDGIVRIATPDTLARSTVVRVYDVRDLAQLYLDRQTLKPPGTPVERPSGDAAAGETLIKIITTSVDPLSWLDAGGSSGAAQYFAGRLVITQTPENHDAIYQLLAALRRPQH